MSEAARAPDECTLPPPAAALQTTQQALVLLKGEKSQVNPEQDKECKSVFSG